MMTRISLLLKQVQSQGHDVWLAGPATPTAVQALERKLGATLPPSYASFLLEYGALSLHSDTVSGVIAGDRIDGEGGTVLGDTESLRSLGALPEGYLAVGPHEDGGYCLDLSRRRSDGESPVVNFEFGSVQDQKSVAPTFEEWLIDFYLKPRSEERA